MHNLAAPGGAGGAWGGTPSRRDRILGGPAKREPLDLVAPCEWRSGSRLSVSRREGAPPCAPRPARRHATRYGRSALTTTTACAACSASRRDTTSAPRPPSGRDRTP